MKSRKLYYFFFISFVVFASLLGTYNEFEIGKVAKTFQLPKFVSTSAFYGYVLILSFYSVLGAYVLIVKRKIFTFHFGLIAGYFLLMSWSLIIDEEQLRYTAIFSSILLVPIGLKASIQNLDERKLALSIGFIMLGFLVITILYSVLNFSQLNRISGIHANPNLLGMWLVSFLVLLLYYRRTLNSYLISLIVLVSFILVVMTGSRTGLALLVIVLFPIFKRKSYTIVLGLVLLIYLVFSSFDLVQISIRGANLLDALSDSGRAGIWKQAYFCINSNPWFGSGMNATEKCLSLGSVFNSYIRIALMVGIPLAIIFFLSFFTVIQKIIFSSSSAVLKGWFVSLPVAFFAEDYVAGFGTPFFPFLLILIALVMLDMEREKMRRKPC